MRDRRLRAGMTLAALLAALVLLPAGLVPLLDWNAAKPWLLRQGAAIMGRDLRVDGAISLAWRSPESGDWLPYLDFTAEQVVVGNPPWAQQSGQGGQGDHLARAARLELTFSPWMLLRQRWQIDTLRLDGLDLVLQRDAQQRKNWRFSERAQSPWRVEVRSLQLTGATVRYVDAPLRLDVQFRQRPQQPQQPKQQNDAASQTLVDLSGRFGQASVAGQLEGGPLNALLNDGGVFPLAARGQVGQVAVDLDGKLINPHQLQQADLHIRLKGDSLSQLYEATNVPLPPTRAFSTQGALRIARVADAEGVWEWRYEHFTGAVGQSDFAGDARFLKGGAKDILSVTSRSQRLRLADYLPSQEQQAQGKSGARVFPDRPVRSERWSRFQADIALQAQQVELRPGVQWQDLSTTIRLQDQVLSATPLRFAMAGGHGQAALTLDGRQQPLRGQLQLQLSELQVGQLLPPAARLQGAMGKFDARAELRGSGDSLAAMLASADGEIKADLGAGKISRFMLEAVGLNLANAVFARLYRDEPVNVLCGAADVQVRQGQARVQHGILNTDDAAILVGGQIDLGQETLALDVVPRARHVRILSLRTPLYIRGTLAHPEVGASKQGLAARAGAAAALALVAPVAAVIPLISPGQPIPADCAPPSAAAARR